jgi:hypothetical protein
MVTNDGSYQCIIKGCYSLAGGNMMKNGDADGLLFDIESIDQLGPERKSDYVRMAIVNCLSKHPEGITSQLLSEHTGLNQRTVKKYLEQLTATREVFKKEYGARIAIYFPNGKETSENEPQILNIGDATFQLQLIENTWGKFIYLQERKKDVYSGITKTIGGIMIDCEGVPELIGVLKEMSSLSGSETCVK